MIDSRSRMPLGRQALLLVVALPFLSGAAALSHELLWTRRLIDLLGATDWVVGRVLGFFFFGISLGGYLATLSSNNKVPAINRLSKIEVLIGLLALPTAFLPIWTDWIWPFIGTELLVSWTGALIKLLLTILVVMPPAVAMGFTLPLFIRSATDQGANVASIGVWIYAVNTLGGVFGLWFTSTCLIGWLGAQGSMIFTSCLNLSVALFLWMMVRFANQTTLQTNAIGNKEPNTKQNAHELKASSRSKKNGSAKTTGITSRNLFFLSFVSGFVVLALEVLLLRLITLVVPSSYHTTSALLANVILVLAFGSGIISLSNSLSFTRTLANNKLLVVAAFFGAAVCIVMCPVFLYDSTNQLISIRYLQALNGLTIDSVGHYWMLVFWLVAASGGLALLFSGLVFPILLTISSESDPAGKKVGLLLAVNGIGGLAGTEIFNSLVISVFGIYDGFIILAVVVLFAVAAILATTNRWLALPATMVLALTIFAGYQFVRDIPYLSPNAKGVKPKIEHFGRDGVWLIVEKRSGATGILVNNQYFLGGSGALVVQRRELLLPWVLKPNAKSVCCLGLATGITASGLEGLNNPPPVTAVELSGNVVKLAKKYFKKESGRFFERKENRVITEDARTYIAASEDQYDLIVGDLYRPFGIGEGRLYSLEHFQNVRRALTDDGIYCQWLPAYQLNEENWLTIAATFQKAFPETLIVYGDPSPRFPVIGLVGRKSDQKWDAKALTSRLQNIPAEAIQQDPQLKGITELIAGVLKKDAFKNHKINTLDNLIVEISAGTHWTLKDLRKNRKPSYEKEFLSGKNFPKFNRRLEKLVDPILSPVLFQRLLKKIEIRASKLK